MSTMQSTRVMSRSYTSVANPGKIVAMTHTVTGYETIALCEGEAIAESFAMWAYKLGEINER